MLGFTGEKKQTPGKILIPQLCFHPWSTVFSSLNYLNIAVADSEKFRKMLHREKEGTRLFLIRNGKKGNSELHTLTIKIIQRRVDNLNPLSCMSEDD